MKTIHLIGLSAILFFTSCQKNSWPCLRASGESITETRTFPSAEGITIKGDINVNIHLISDQEPYLLISGPQNLVENIRTSQVGGNIDIFNRHCLLNNDAVTLDMYINDVAHCEVTGSGNVYFLDHFSVDNIELMITGSGDIHADLDAVNTACKIVGSGNVDITGETSDMDLIINGAGDLDAYEFETVTSNVKISGSGNANIYVTSVLDIVISGSGDVRYKGSPQVNVSITGSGNASHTD